MLLSVIKKALNRYDDPVGTYKTMDELTGALSEIIAKFNFFISKKSFEDTGKYILETRLKTKEESCAEQIKTGAAGALTLHLYRYPLYDYVPTDKKDINILVIGGGTYSSKFIDLVFELSQIKDCYASVTVASMDSDKDKITYLSSRPEFENFFEVDGKIPTKTDSPYGSLTYREINKIDANSEIKDIKALMSETQYSYIFIAVNDENINAYTAEKISRSLPSGANALISYVVYSGKTKKPSVGGGRVVSVNVRDTLEKSKEYKELRRMALNVHLTWSPDGIADIKKAEGTFANKYNFCSSLEAAVSIKYKLHSVGINLNSEELRENVKTVRYLLNQSKLKKDVRELVMYEHRRWNVGQIVSSWRTLTPDMYNLLTSSTKLRAKKLHPCLVSGNANAVLTQSKWTTNNFALWDTAQEGDLEGLDDLDKMSIRLHQHFAELADELKKNPIVLYSKISLLRALLSGSSELADCFELYCYSVNALFDKGANRETVKIYWYHLNAFSCSVKQHEHDIAQFSEVQKLFENIQTMLFPLVEAGSYTDWKSKDCDIINNIPFILSYSPAIHICVPLALAEKRASTDILFSNAASALVLNPSIVTYVIDGEAVKKSFGGFINTISYISNIFKKHRLQTKINITVFEKSGTGDIINVEKLKEEFSLINYIEEIEYGGPDEISVFREYLNESLHSKNESRRFTAIEYNNTKISGLLQGANYLGKNVSEDEQSVNAEKICYSTLFPYYTYDSKMQRFTASDGCRYFAYVTGKRKSSIPKHSESAES